MAEKTEPSSHEAPHLVVAPGPHLADRSLTTRRMMLDVLIALVPATGVALWVFGWYTLVQLALCVGGCVAAEFCLTRVRRKPVSIGDLSAVVTGVILAFSLPAATPWWVSLIGAFAAIGLGKIVFGGLGANIFNPAMVGRAFVMVAFAKFVAYGGYVVKPSSAWVHTVTQATPMTEYFKRGADPDGILWRLFVGNINGSLGETSALALLLGGAYLLVRRTASWEIPAGAIAGLLAIAGLDNLLHMEHGWTVLHHLLGGAFLLGALFIVTDPVSSPITPKGKFIFGALFGVLVMLIRVLTNAPEGVMYSVLLVNSVAPLINRWTIPRPVGGPIPTET